VGRYPFACSSIAYLSPLLWNGRSGVGRLFALFLGLLVNRFFCWHWSFIRPCPRHAVPSAGVVVAAPAWSSAPLFSSVKVGGDFFLIFPPSFPLPSFSAHRHNGFSFFFFPSSSFYFLPSLLPFSFSSCSSSSCSSFSFLPSFLLLLLLLLFFYSFFFLPIHLLPSSSSSSFLSSFSSSSPSSSPSPLPSRPPPSSSSSSFPSISFSEYYLLPFPLHLVPMERTRTEIGLYLLGWRAYTTTTPSSFDERGRTGRERHKKGPEREGRQMVVEK